jgi:hypothetical protein
LCLEKTNELLSELEGELSVLTDPGEYDQLPPAVVAEELGTTVNKVRLLIKSGEILAAGRPAHEYVSREELASACEVGVKKLLRRLDQEAPEIFEKSVSYLHQGQLRLAERSCQRLIARESIVGIYALPYETALLLARADIDEVNVRLRFIRRAANKEQACLIRNLRRILRGMSFQNEEVKAINEGILYVDGERNVDGLKVFGSKLDEHQQSAMFITTIVCDEINRRWKKPSRIGQSEELQRIIRDAVYSWLHAHDSCGRLASSKLFLDSIRALVPRYYEPAQLIGGLVKDK